MTTRRRSTPSAALTCETSWTTRAEFTPPARVVTLARNYRSTQSILDATNAVIGLAPERFTKDLWSERRSDERPRLVTVADEAEQARYIADQVLERREAAIALKAQAVLFRASSHSAALELELVRRNIPYIKFGGLKFLEVGTCEGCACLPTFA